MKRALISIAMIAAVTAGCKSPSSASTTKDVVQTELDQSTGQATRHIYFVQSGVVYRANCPQAKDRSRDWRAQCPADSRMAMPEFVQGMQTAYSAAYQVAMPAQAGQTLSQILQYMSADRITIETARFGQGGLQLTALFPRVFAGAAPKNQVTVPEGDSYYMTLFGYQRRSTLGQAFDPKSAHTFASFSRVDRQGSQVQLREEHTISWLPRANNGEVVVATPVPGRNYSLQESLVFGARSNIEMRRWGPFRISKALYEKALARKQTIDYWADVAAKNATLYPDYTRGSAYLGNIKIYVDGIFYIAMDGGTREGTILTTPRGANNCFHAVGDILATGRSEDWMINGTARGFRATEQTLFFYLQQAGQEFIDYPTRSLTEYVQGFDQVAGLLGIKNVAHIDSVPAKPANAGRLGAQPQFAPGAAPAAHVN